MKKAATVIIVIILIICGCLWLRVCRETMEDAKKSDDKKGKKKETKQEIVSETKKDNDEGISVTAIIMLILTGIVVISGSAMFINWLVKSIEESGEKKDRSLSRTESQNAFAARQAALAKANH